MFVVDLSQSMEAPIQGGGPASLPGRYAVPAAMLGTPGTRMEAFKKSALAFVSKRPGDAIGLVVFSNNGYLVTPANFDHESMSHYLLMTGTHTLVNEGYTGIGEGLATANRFFEQQRESEGRRVRGQVILLFTDGENNVGREPMIEIERARKIGTRVYMISIDVQSEANAQLAAAIPTTGGKFYDVRRTADLEQALNDINQVEKGVFHTVGLTRSQPAYHIFVLLALACLALRLCLHALPPFVEIS
jgi:Ca-activated chloride channel family protein